MVNSPGGTPIICNELVQSGHWYTSFSNLPLWTSDSSLAGPFIDETDDLPPVVGPSQFDLKFMNITDFPVSLYLVKNGVRSLIATVPANGESPYLPVPSGSAAVKIFWEASGLHWQGCFSGNADYQPTPGTTQTSIFALGEYGGALGYTSP